MTTLAILLLAIVGDLALALVVAAFIKAGRG